MPASKLVEKFWNAVVIHFLMLFLSLAFMNIYEFLPHVVTDPFQETFQDNALFSYKPKRTGGGICAVVAHLIYFSIPIWLSYLQPAQFVLEREINHLKWGDLTWFDLFLAPEREIQWRILQKSQMFHPWIKVPFLGLIK